MSLIKLVDSSSFFNKEEQTISIIDFNETKGLLKQATDLQIQEYVSKITPKSDKIYLHILALGSSEYWGSNRNADRFNEQNLIDCYKTFETSPAHVFRNHINKDPQKAIGKVIFSVYNHRMHRVELIAYVDKTLAPDIIDRIESGDWPATSMACKTPYDVCSICGNKAHTRQEYCEHLRDQLGKVYPDGRKVSALNVAPLKFFDISIVVRPADVTSSVLQKVASVSTEYSCAVEYYPDQHTVIGSVEEAELEGLSEEGIDKQATIKKLSEFIKEIEGGPILNYSETLDNILTKVKDPELKILNSLINFKLYEILDSLAHLGISPSIAFLSELIARKTLGSSASGLGSLIESLIKKNGLDNINLDFNQPVSKDIHSGIIKILSTTLENSSLFPEYVEKRSMLLQSTNVGYNGNGPYIEPTAFEKFKKEHLTEIDDKSNVAKLFNTLLTIGGQALLAKWYITRSIDEKMKETMERNNSGVKIILVKSASDYISTYKLAKESMIRTIQK